MCPGDDHKISLCAVRYLRKRFIKRQAEHFIGSGQPQLLCIFLAVIHCKDRQAQQLCKLHNGCSHMSTAADYQLRHRAKALRKDVRACNRVDTSCCAALQFCQVLQQYGAVSPLHIGLPSSKSSWLPAASPSNWATIVQPPAERAFCSIV